MNLEKLCAQVEDARGYTIEGNVFENTADTPTQLRTKPLELSGTASDIRCDADGDAQKEEEQPRP